MDRLMHSAKASVIKTMALDLGVDEVLRDVCPFCHAEHEKSFSIKRTSVGLLYQCYRNSCPASGFISSQASSITPNKKKEFTPKTFKRELSALPRCLKQAIEENYGLDPGPLGWRFDVSSNRLYMPLRDYSYHVWGAVTKKLNPLWTGCSNTDGGPKVVLYKESDVPTLHFAKVQEPVRSKFDVVLVEDVISSEVLGNNGIPSVAILGTYLGERELQHLAILYADKKVAIALDADATTKAIKIVSRYSLYFSDVSIIVNEKDPKDMSPEEIGDKYARE